MNNLLIIILFALFIVATSSCSSYVNNLYKKIDSELGTKQNNGDKLDLSLFKNSKLKKRQDYEQQFNSLNSKAIPNLYPTVKRNYSTVKRRTTAQDLTDNSNNSASLWNDSQNSFLFSTNNHKKINDIVSIDVMAKLKQEIGLELSRLFSDSSRRNLKKTNNKNNDDKNAKDGKDSEKKDATDQQTAQNPGQDQNKTANNQENKNNTANDESKKYNPITDDRIYDQVPGVIAEELNRDYVIIQGRKEILYMNRKRYLEVKAIVARKDITDNYTVASSKFLESNIKIIK